MSISVERYISCCYPNNNFSFKFLLVPLPIIFTLLYNVPKFFELSTCSKNIDFPENVPNDILQFTHFNVSDDSNSTFNLLPSLSVPTNKTEDQFQNVPIFYLPNITEIHLDTFDPFMVQFPTRCDKGYRTTGLRKNRWYIIFYVFWSKFILVEIVPWVTVIILNIFTWRKIRQFQVNRDRLLRNNRTSGSTDEGSKTFFLYYYTIIMF